MFVTTITSVSPLKLLCCFNVDNCGMSDKLHVCMYVRMSWRHVFRSSDIIHVEKRSCQSETSVPPLFASLVVVVRMCRVWHRKKGSEFSYIGEDLRVPISPSVAVWRRRSLQPSSPRHHYVPSRTEAEPSRRGPRSPSPPRPRQVEDVGATRSR